MGDVQQLLTEGGKNSGGIARNRTERIHYEACVNRIAVVNRLKRSKGIREHYSSGRQTFFTSPGSYRGN